MIGILFFLPSLLHAQVNRDSLFKLYPAIEKLMANEDLPDQGSVSYEYLHVNHSYSPDDSSYDSYGAPYEIQFAASYPERNGVMVMKRRGEIIAWFAHREFWNITPKGANQQYISAITDRLPLFTTGYLPTGRFGIERCFRSKTVLKIEVDTLAHLLTYYKRFEPIPFGDSTYSDSIVIRFHYTEDLRLDWMTHYIPDLYAHPAIFTSRYDSIAILDRKDKGPSYHEIMVKHEDIQKKIAKAQVDVVTSTFVSNYYAQVGDSIRKEQLETLVRTDYQPSEEPKMQVLVFQNKTPGFETFLDELEQQSWLTQIDRILVSNTSSNSDVKAFLETRQYPWASRQFYQEERLVREELPLLLMVDGNGIVRYVLRRQNDTIDWEAIGKLVN